MPSEAEKIIASGGNPFHDVPNVAELFEAAVGAGVGIGLNAEGVYALIDDDFAIRVVELLLERYHELVDD